MEEQHRFAGFDFHKEPRGRAGEGRGLSWLKSIEWGDLISLFALLCLLAHHICSCSCLFTGSPFFFFFSPCVFVLTFVHCLGGCWVLPSRELFWVEWRTMSGERGSKHPSPYRMTSLPPTRYTIDEDPKRELFSRRQPLWLGPFTFICLSKGLNEGALAQRTVRMANFFFDIFDGENLWRLIRETNVIGAIGRLVFHISPRLIKGSRQRCVVLVPERPWLRFLTRNSRVVLSC